jgi:Baseplate J-like protein
LPIIVTAAGMQPQPYQQLSDQIEAAAVTAAPGITLDLPLTLTEDFLSTATPAAAACNQAQVEFFNSLTPAGANQQLLLMLGQLFGIPYGQLTNTSVFVQFSSPNLGYVVPGGALVGDTGGNVYQIPSTGTVIQSGGTSALVQAIAVQPGSTFGVPAGTVTSYLTSIPSGITLTVTNPAVGTPGGVAETWGSYRARVLQAMLAACVGSARYIKTLVAAVPGVQKNTVSVQAASPGFRVIVGGSADPYALAFAISQAVGDPGQLVGHAAGGTTITTSLIDPPNTYPITWVNPAVQTLAIAATWNTTASNFTGGGAVPGLVQPPIVAYANALYSGAPINLLELNNIFQTAIAGILDPNFLTRLIWQITINGSVVAPGTGTQIVSGDAESYFLTPLSGSGITVTQG